MEVMVNELSGRIADTDWIMRRCTTTLLPMLLLSILAGCASVQPGQKYGSTPVASLKSAYVVIPDEADRDVAIYIQSDLAQRGLLVTVGPLSSKPSDADFYVTYSDHWTWDVSMYLQSLDIQFVDNRSGQLIASGGYRQGFFHGYPDVRETTQQVVNSIYAAK
jgi:hypothetical protein